MPLAQSWITAANTPDTPFPLNNLPCGVFSTGDTPARCGVAIGDQIVDITALEAAGIIEIAGGPAFGAPGWNGFMARGPAAWQGFRDVLTGLLRAGSASQSTVAPHMVPLANAQLHLPFAVTEFTDFYASRDHATNVGTMFRGAENALPANWLHIPIGYNGRASSVVVSGTDIIRPNGQIRMPDADTPHFGPTRRLDMELELGAVIGTPSVAGQPVTVAEADAMIFGYVLLNDWSARDIQAWEYQPLGPFQSKAFATSISPWIVTKAALDPFRVPAPARDVPLLPYLQEAGPLLYDIDLEVTMAPADAPATRITRTNARHLYYAAAQQLAHHASSGCAMRCGDLIGSGTISGPDADARGSLLELSWGGETPITLADGTRRSFAADGDTITLHGAAHGDGYRVGFGDCGGRIMPAIAFPRST